MSKIFISHSSHDNAKALAVAQWLEEMGWGTPFFDISPRRGLAPGKRWREALTGAAGRCEAVICLLTPSWLNSGECRGEFSFACYLSKPLIGVIVDPSVEIKDVPDELRSWQICTLVNGENRRRFTVHHDPLVPLTQVDFAEAGLVLLHRGLQASSLNPSEFPWPPPHDPNRLPYRGLKALEAEDAAVFFGREAPLIRALDTLRRMTESGEQLFVILGASGTGKSSFLRAGLWPRLKRDDRHFLPLPVIRPERAAITGQSGLVESLESMFREQKAAKTRANLRAILAKPEGIVELLTEIQTNAQKRLGPGAMPPTLVIGLDQAEELFGKEGADEAGQLLDCLNRLLGQIAHDRSSVSIPRLRVVILAVIRSDSYEQMQTARALAGIRQTPFNLPALAPGEYKMVIEGPAARSTAAGHKLTIEPALTEQLLKDAEGADALPLLAFILERLLIDYGADGDLLLKEYEALRGLEGSIESAVNEAWKDPTREPVVPSDEATRRRLLNQAFPALVTLDDEAAKAKRRVATWSLLPQETYPLLERLVSARVLLKDRRQLVDGQEAVVIEVAHEALIRHWSHLKSWVDINREFLTWQQRLNTTMKRWQKQHRPAGLLLRGLPLREAEDWLKKQPDSFSPDERAFIVSSRLRKVKERMAAAIGVAIVLWLIGTTTWLWQKGYNLEQAGLKVQSLVVSIHVPPQMVEIPGGTFQMGDVEKMGELWRNPVHQVSIKPFNLSKFEVTFDEYDRFAIDTGGRLPEDQGWGRDNRPVINVSWDDANAYAEWLSQQTGHHYRLPTELEWEYAARSGAKQQTWAGTSEESHLGEYAVFLDNSGNHTAEVGMKQANGFGLHDLSGNVWEWVEDCLHSTYKGAPQDGSAWLEQGGGDCGRRVIRGGSWDLNQEFLLASNRLGITTVNRTINLGFRLVLDLEY
ncbi:MAG: SUMF1/EgtB/PvdO family nonheme iron enzyme [Nitrospira sp.]|nr:SUMF1/EgtB/PvdO family nonheme iron enzyme [Nitrospira sp.]